MKEEDMFKYLHLFNKYNVVLLRSIVLVIHQRYYGYIFTFIYDFPKEYSNIIRIYLNTNNLEDFVKNLDAASITYSIGNATT